MQTFSRKVSRIEYKNMSVGKLMTVTYVPETQGRLWNRGRVSSDNRNSGVAVWILPLLGAGVFWGAIINAVAKTNRKQVRFLQEGVAVPAIVRSGQVSKSGNTISYTVQYSYWTGEKKRKGQMIVPETSYRSMTENNPYFTVLYDAAHPREHLSYFQITQARLAVAASE
ncbi:MAG: hypothetical protein EOO39_18135 [Cytophagaceae bacterium]|nr:MAG: hypothetical protein EOO39_18135 [Cytophagaceae bacterium]